MDRASPSGGECAGSTPVGCTIKTHAKGAYKTPTRVSFSMQNRGELPFLWQFTLFVVSSLIAVGICSSLALENLKPLTIAQKGFLHDKERMTFTDLINDKNGRPHSYERSRSFVYKGSFSQGLSLPLVFGDHRQPFPFACSI